MTNPKKLEITPVSDWLNDYEVVELPSGKRVGLRQVDIWRILTADGEIPNVLMPIVLGHTNDLPTDTKGNMIANVEDIKPMNDTLDRLVCACFAKPRIVDSIEAVHAGEGIMTDMIPYLDKMALIAWAQGGQAALDAMSRFLKQQLQSLGDVQTGDDVSSESEPNPEHSKSVVSVSS